MLETMDGMGGENLQNLLGDIGDGVILTDADEKVLYLNQAAREILCLQNRDAQGMYFKDICPLVNLASGKPFESPLKQAMREEHSVGLAKDVGVIRSAGAAYLSATCSPMYGKDGKLRGCSVMLRDVTHLRRLEMKLETNHVYMRSVFEAAKIGLCVLNTEGAIVDINSAALETMDVGYRSVMGLQFGDAFRCENSLLKGCGHGPNCRHCPIRNNLEAAIMDDDFTGDFTAAIYSAKSESRKLVWLRVFVSQVFSEDAKQIIVALINVSNRKQRERELELARLQAENASRAKTQFLATMSHELRTPINGMNGMIDLTLRGELGERQRENLLTAKRCAVDLLHIVNDILDFSKLDSGHMTIESVGLDLRALLRDVLRPAAEMAKEKGLWFCWPRIGKLPHYIMGDSLRLRQIFRNILMNALKFTIEGTILVSAEVGRRKGKETLEFAVHDTGIGMPLEALGKLFEPFSQMDSSISREYGGTGLGLMIVRELVEAMNGRVQVHTVPCKGSSVGFWIPLIPASEAKPQQRERTVFLNPRFGKEQGSAKGSSDTNLAPKDSGDLEDVEDLMRYCREKLGGE